MLQLVEIVFYLFGIKIGRQALKVKCHSGHMTAVIVKCAWTSAKDGDVALKTLK